MIKELFTNIPVLVVTGVAAITSGSAVSKIAAQYAPELATKEIAVREAKKMDTSSPEVTPALFIEGEIPVSGNGSQVQVTEQGATTQPATVAAGQFTLAMLGLHNKPGDCYVAYKTVVYDVSAHPSWQKCTHHGVVGGRDITSSFPHSTSYFASLPQMGTLQGGSTTPPTSHNDDEDEDEDEHEQEDDDRKSDDRDNEDERDED